MARSWRAFCLLLFLLLGCSTSSAAELSPSQLRSLFRLRRILHNPAAFDRWDNRTDPCALPPSGSVSVSCSGNRVIGISVSGDARAPLPSSFSIDSLFTTLSRLPNLTSVSLVSLGIWGPMSAKVDRLQSLRRLNLSSNYISGAIPPGISKMETLQSLVLDGNLINGTLPAFLFSMPAIRYLDLSQNRLTGSLPATLPCAAQLGFVDVSDNRLVGSLPGCISLNTTKRTVIVAGNCLQSGSPTHQRPQSYCTEGAFAAVVPSDPAVPSARRPEKKSSRLGLVLGIVGGVIGAALVLGLLLAVVMKRARASGRPKTGSFLPKTAAVGGQAPSSVHASPAFPANARHMNQAARMGTLGLPPYRVFSLEELEEATDNFDAGNSIGNDSGTQMYRGWLRDGSAVMVRCLKLKHKYSAQSVAQFIDAVSKLRHRHLLSVLGHCVDADQETGSSAANTVYVVLEHVSNETLRSYLTGGRRRETLKWPQRVAAVIGVARGIQFLHGATVAGSDLSIESILLDEALTAKITKYNLPMVSTNQNNKESPFAATEETDFGGSCVERGEKKDVYQLGLILLEMITGRAVADGDGLETLKTQLRRGLNEGRERFHGLVDPSIHGTFAYDSLSTAVQVALNCVASDLDQRPSIDDILWNLQYSVQIQDGWTSNDSFVGLS